IRDHQRCDDAGVGAPGKHRASSGCRSGRQTPVCIFYSLSLPAVRRFAGRGRSNPAIGFVRHCGTLAMNEPPTPGIELSAEQQRRRRSRSVAIALTLGALVLLFYIVTIVKLGPGVLNR